MKTSRRRNKIEITSNTYGTIRYTELDGDTYFVACDVAKVLNYSRKSPSAIQRFCKNPKTILINTRGGKQKLYVINKEDTLKLICFSQTQTVDYKNGLIEWLYSNGLIDKKHIAKERNEVAFSEILNKSLQPLAVSIACQYKVLDYRIDFYIPELNLAIEYDENNHSGYTYEQQEGRQLEIKSILNCKFVRVSDKNDDHYNLGVVFKYIYENCNLLKSA